MVLICCPFLFAQQTPPQDQTKPEPVKTSITVVEKIAAETPANVTVLDATALQETPGANLDDRLRDLPGFSLFRRSSSLVAHPTTQGISLRGIGSSGASRTLVLWDGVPANDPFGGWVYWTQFIPDEMQRVEVSRGAATSVFGEKAMTGAIGVFTRERQPLHLLAAYEGGNENAHDVTAGFSHSNSLFAVSGAGRAFTTDGYYIVPERIRGAADTRAGVRFVTADVHLDHYTSLGNFFVKFNMLAEDRKNGTTLTHNSTSMGTISLRYEKEYAHDSVSVLGYDTDEGFHSSFTSVTADRNTERLSFLQSVPSRGTGGALLWQHHNVKWNLLGGADVDRLDGVSTDHLVPTGQRVGGGTQLQHGVFGQTDVTLGPVRLFAGLRHSFTGQNTTFLSPSAGAVIGRKSLRLRGSTYRAFRAPTLNELYREFRVGNTITQANAGLQAETVFGYEVGADWIGESSSARVTWYHNDLHGLITNVTVSNSGGQIVRQRRNAAEATSRGGEVELNRRWRNFEGQAKYLFVESRYITGFRVAQVPKHQGTAHVAYQRGGTMASVGIRSFAYQFDDDLNVFRLPGYAVMELVARQKLTKSLTADVALDNALNRSFYTAFTPTPNIGAPRLWRVGIRWDGRL